MIIYLAAYKTIEKIYTGDPNDVYILSSFFEHKNGKFGDYVYSKKHILDSGAFSTFSNPNQAKNNNWDDYVSRYINFIKLTSQKLFFELDIDAIIGLKKVEYYRSKIEDAVGIQPIPVWHKSRGWDYYEMMVEKYKYVAIGTTLALQQGKKIRSNPMILKKFIDTAHNKGAKIHGLGFTSTPNLVKLKFDSVDSTTWINGAKFGNIMIIDKNGCIRQKSKKSNTRVNDPNAINLYNFNVWLRFQKYAELNL